MNPYSDLPRREQERLARVGTTSWSDILRGWWEYDCACGEYGAIDGSESTSHACPWCGTVHTTPGDERRELIQFRGTIGRAGDVGPSALRHVTVEVERGSEAHVLALSRGWLEQFRGGYPPAEWPVNRDWRESIT